MKSVKAFLICLLLCGLVTGGAQGGEKKKDDKQDTQKKKRSTNVYSQIVIPSELPEGVKVQVISPERIDVSVDAEGLIERPADNPSAAVIKVDKVELFLSDDLENVLQTQTLTAPPYQARLKVPEAAFWLGVTISFSDGTYRTDLIPLRQKSNAIARKQKDRGIDPVLMFLLIILDAWQRQGGRMCD